MSKQNRTDAAHRGLVKISNGGTEAWVVPSSVDAFERNGWSVDQEATQQAQPDSDEVPDTERPAQAADSAS